MKQEICRLLVVAAALVVCLAVSETSTTFVPVLSRLGTKQAMSDLGEHVDSTSFKDQLTISLSKVNQLTLVLLTSSGASSLTSGDFVQEMRRFELDESDVLFQPQVNEAYVTLISYLSSHPSIQVNKVVVNDVNEGLLRFVEALNANKPVIMLQEESNRSDRHKREVAAKEDDEVKANKTRNYVFGDQCAAFFDSVGFVDMSTPQTGPLVDLPINANDLKFTCVASGNTQVLTISFDNNTGIMGKSISQLSLQFQASNNTLYYVLNSTQITLENSDKYSLLYMGTPYSMETPMNFSFACTRTPFVLRITNPETKSTLKLMFYIENLQLQASGIVPNITAYSFGQINYCQGFFSSGIWMAITSSLLLGLILAFGITALLTIQTNDRLDDPKGKPLNIGVEK